jgi:hypothetical protein
MNEKTDVEEKRMSKEPEGPDPLFSALLDLWVNFSVNDQKPQEVRLSPETFRHFLRQSEGSVKFREKYLDGIEHGSYRGVPVFPTVALPYDKKVVMIGENLTLYW